MRISGSRTQRVLRQKGLRITVQVDEAASVVARGTVSLAGAKAVVRTQTTRARFTKASKATLRIGFSRKNLATLRKALRKGVRLNAKLIVTATDSSGKRSATEGAFSVRR